LNFPAEVYHVTARGNERRDIFRDGRDRQQFLVSLAALPERFGGRVHAYVLTVIRWQITSNSGVFCDVQYPTGLPSPGQRE
jgi:hypothetical protein